MTTKNSLILQLVRLLAPHNLPEQRRLAIHHHAHSTAQVRESLGNWLAITAVTAAESAAHCQSYPLYSRR